MKKLTCLILSILLTYTVSTALAEDSSGSTQDPPACTHSYGEGVVTTSPTCGQTGVKTYTCTLCNATKTETISATGEHIWNGGTVSSAATCRAAGVRTYTCTICGGTKTEPIAIDPNAHSYGAWTSGQPDSHVRTCPCGATQSAAHSFDVSATVPATCLEEGATVYGCSTCGHIKSVAIPKLTTHTYDNDCDADCNVCGQIREASHKYSTAWSRDGISHWHACAKCGAKADVKKHIPGPAATEEKAQLCLTCGYVLTSRRQHTHTFETEYTSDETGHWHACTGCEEQGDFEDHVYDNSCDPDCNICGYVTDTAHTADAQWSTDESGHWHICANCGVFFQYDAHTPGSDGQCSVCGYALAATEQTHTHRAASGWHADENDHWKLCECGEETDREAHNWQESADSKILACTVCGAEKAQPSSDSGIGLLPIVLLVTSLLLAAVCVVLLILLRKNSGKYTR